MDDLQLLQQHVASLTKQVETLKLELEALRQILPTSSRLNPPRTSQRCYRCDKRVALVKDGRYRIHRDPSGLRCVAGGTPAPREG